MQHLLWKKDQPPPPPPKKKELPIHIKSGNKKLQQNKQTKTPPTKNLTKQTNKTNQPTNQQQQRIVADSLSIWTQTSEVHQQSNMFITWYIKPSENWQWKSEVK